MGDNRLEIPLNHLLVSPLQQEPTIVARSDMYIPLRAEDAIEAAIAARTTEALPLVCKCRIGQLFYE